MKQPIEVRISSNVSSDAGATYVRYSDAPIVRTEDVIPTCGVAADLDEAGDVGGIKVLCVNDLTIRGL
jgi:hypothetical protein